MVSRQRYAHDGPVGAEAAPRPIGQPKGQAHRTRKQLGEASGQGCREVDWLIFGHPGSGLML